MSWNTVRPGMSVFSKNTGPYRVISAPRYSSLHTVILLSKDEFTNAMVHHIVPVSKRTGTYVAVSVMDIVSMCVSVKIKDCTNVQFVCKLPNRIDKD